MAIRFPVVLLALAVLTACTSGGPGDASPTRPAPPSPGSSGSPSSASTQPLSTGPVLVTAARSCPWASQSFVKETVGMRQGRITVLRSGATVIGCRFYASQVEPYHSSEHLPGPTQPVVEISTVRYASATAAHNAFVLAAQRGTDASTVTIARGVPGVTYRTAFYGKDAARDWACGWSIGSTLLLVRLAEDGSAGANEAVAVAAQVTRAR